MLIKKINFKNPLFINLLIVGGTTLFVKLLGVFKETYVGSTFGLSEFLDTYALAILVPTFIQNVFVSAIKNIFIPNYIYEKNSTNQIGSFQTFACLLILTITIFFSICIYFFENSIFEHLFPNHTPEYYLLIHNQLIVVLPCIVLWGLSGFTSSLLEIEKKYFYSSISSIYIPIFTLINVIFYRDELGVRVLAYGALTGTILSFIHLLIGSLYFKLIKFRNVIISKNIMLMIRQLPAKITSGLLTGINPIVDQIFAAQLVTGSVIALAYAEKIPAFGISIAIVALGDVLLPHFSEIVTKDLKKAYKELFKILKISFFLSLLFSIIMIFFSVDIISILFERKTFSREDTLIVSKIQQILLLHVPFYLITRVLVKFLTSINKNNFMALISLASVLINILMNYLLIDKYKVYGLAISTTIVLVVNSLIFLFFTIRLQKKLI